MAWLLSLKVLLISMGMVFIGLSLRVSVPLVLEFLVSHVPLMWASFLSWLRPPYLYVIINAIIITIVASTRFHQRSSNREEHSDLPPSENNSPEFGMNLDSRAVAYEHREDAVVVYEHREEAAVVYEQREETAVISDLSVSEVKKAVVVNGSEPQEEEEEEEEDKFVGSSATLTSPKRIDSSEYLNLSPAEKPLVSTRFGHRKPVKASPEGGSGRALRVSKPKRNETLENTWKAITEGRAMPLSRHMKKCETWENHGRQINVMDPLSSSPVKKSETLKDRTNQQSAAAAAALNWSPAPSTRLRKEPSLSQDELNRRVEAFIKKFNEEMRLQRQESLNQYKEMINRGSH